MKSSREQFEEYVRSKGMDDDWYFFTNIHPNHYDDDNINDMWQAWQASRAAIEITLPDCDDYHSTWQYQDAAEIKIKELGLTVK